MTPRMLEWLLSKTNKQTRSVDKDVEQRELLCTVGRKKNWYSHYEKQYGGSSKKSQVDPTISK